MAEKKVIGEIHLPSGERVPVIGENERFYLCKGCQFLKTKWELHKPEKKTEKGEKKK